MPFAVPSVQLHSDTSESRYAAKSMSMTKFGGSALMPSRHPSSHPRQRDAVLDNAIRPGHKSLRASRTPRRTSHSNLSTQRISARSPMAGPSRSHPPSNAIALPFELHSNGRVRWRRNA